MKRSLALSLSLALTVIAATGAIAAYAQGAPGGAQPDPTAIYREAGANEDQLQKIRDMAKEFEQGAIVKAERAKNLVKKMQDLSLQPTPDEKTVLTTQDEINGLQSDIANMRIKVMMKIRLLLSKEQREHLVDIMKKRMVEAKAAPGAQGQH